MNNTVLELIDLKKYFPLSKSFSKKTFVRAVNGVSFRVAKGTTLGLVGESGCGKTTIGNAILGFHEPTAGKVFFEGQELFGLSKKKLKEVRWKMQMIFQDPLSSLDPRWTVRSILSEPLIIHGRAKGKKRERKLKEIMGLVGLMERHLDAYPHEFSGGQRQRLVIARAMMANPTLMILDEPTSALDVSVQAQILNLLKELQRKFNMTYLFISHDLSVIRHMSDQIGVMYLGKIVETAPARDLFQQPRHPYTQALLSAIQDLTADREEIILPGEVPSVIDPPAGCVFHPRCAYRRAHCSKRVPSLFNVSNVHAVSCFLYERNEKEMHR
jgi:oligopeptide/dipeptide ABC transporter ATP-binding protein